ncbi:MAG: FKBP-type peptidyl-prolyl cis-trans isomerase [Fimbriimonadaceae bacterium]|nr:FKBP-type peptidyl-prolyl cis-trans isomerase [Chitinophagales bacterium]
MKIKYFLLAITVIIVSCESSKKNASTTGALTNSNDSVSYALGINIGESLQKQGLTDLNTDLMIQAMKLAFADDTTALMDNESSLAYLNGYFQKMQLEKAKKSLDEGKKFLEDNKTKPGIITTASGLQYEVITEGTGATPVITDKVQVFYTGTLLDGSPIESNVGKPLPAPYPVKDYMKGWTEALLLMKEGSKWKLYIPSELGYGQMGGGPIPPNAAVIFEVELVKVVPGDVE